MKKNNLKKCCVCRSTIYGSGLSNEMGTCICLNCARTIRDIMLLQEGNMKEQDYCQTIIGDGSCYIPPYPVSRK